MQVNISIPDDHIRNAVGGARFGYWASAPEATWSRVNLTLTLREHEYGTSDPQTFNLTLDSWIHALALMGTHSSRGVCEALARILAGRADGNDGDMLVQFACFGELKYG